MNTCFSSVLQITLNWLPVQQQECLSFFLKKSLLASVEKLEEHGQNYSPRAVSLGCGGSQGPSQSCSSYTTHTKAQPLVVQFSLVLSLRGASVAFPMRDGSSAGIVETSSSRQQCYRAGFCLYSVNSLMGLIPRSV